MDYPRIANRMGLNWNYKGPDEVYDELSGCMESLKTLLGNA